jgi:hypothetical protein
MLDMMAIGKTQRLLFGLTGIGIITCKVALFMSDLPVELSQALLIA